MNSPLQLLIIAGARPNFMKIAPLIHAIQRHNQELEAGRCKLEASRPSSGLNPSPISHLPTSISYKLIHTGQHYDAKMSDVFFRELGIPQPDVNLEVGSGSHAVQTANLMLRFEPVLLSAFAESADGRPKTEDRPPSSGSVGSASQSALSSALHSISQLPSPGSHASGVSISHLRSPAPPALPDWLIVVGDVNSTMACTLVASKLGVKVAHIEAGLRSRDRTMPEEINRLVTDALADLLLTPSEDANENLRREGVPEEKIKLVGNIMIDALVANLPQARQSRILETAGVTPGGYAYVTLHRPANVDSRESLGAIMRELTLLSQRLPVVFPIHPRTRHRLAEFGISVPFSGVSGPPLDVERPMLNVECSPAACPSTLNSQPGLLFLDPVGYHDSLCLTGNARLVLTDSGGLQEESTWFRTPCLTLRPNTERPVTVTTGSNRLTTVDRLRSDFEAALNGGDKTGAIPPLWDGRTAERILAALFEGHAG